MHNTSVGVVVGANDTEAFHRAVQILQSTLCVKGEKSGEWQPLSEKEARVAAAALDRSHMLQMPPPINARNMGIRKDQTGVEPE